MRTSGFRRMLMALTWLTSAVTLTAQRPASPDVVIRQAWIREAAAGQASTSAYFVVENRSSSPVTIVGVSSPVAASSELHTMQMQHASGSSAPRGGAMDTMMRMVQVEQVVVPAQGTVEFKPGGNHVMLFKIASALTLDVTVPLTLRFADGATKDVTATVGSRAAVNPPAK